MLWYGLKNLKFKNEIRNIKLKNKLQIRSLNINTGHLIQLNWKEIFFYLPPQWDMLIFILFNKIIAKNKFYLISYLYSSVYFFYFPININFGNFFYEKKSNVFHFKNLFVNNFFSIYWTFFKNIFFSFSKIYFKKLKFKGKGYYIYKNSRNTIATQFGYSHMTRTFGYVISLKFLTKTSVFIYGVNNFDILKMGKNFYFRRPYNIFTGKGVRFNKQVIYKKTGKISTYR